MKEIMAALEKATKKDLNQLANELKKARQDKEELSRRINEMEKVHSMIERRLSGGQPDDEASEDDDY